MPKGWMTKESKSTKKLLGNFDYEKYGIPEHKEYFPMLGPYLYGNGAYFG